MRKLFLSFLCVFCLIQYTKAQNSSDKVQQAIINMYSQLLVFPQEKIYAQTDRPYYINGEKLYFRAFLIHASTMKPSEISRYVYVELISPDDEVVVRQQIRVEDQMYYGALDLPEELPEGHYRLRAYTRYMQNSGESYFYTRPVFVADPNSAKRDIETKFEFLSDKQVRVGVKFKDMATQETRYPESIELQLKNDKKSKEAKPDAEGWIYEKFNLKDTDTDRNLRIEYNEEYNTFTKYIRIPYNTDLPEVNFYPEGGELIAGVPNRIAIKAILPDGNAADIEGAVFDSKDELQTSFSTQHEGMGDFTLQVRQGEGYYAQCLYNGENIKVKLPELKTDVYALQAVWEEDGLEVSVRKPENNPEHAFYLLMHRQGVPVYFEEWDFSAPRKKFDRSRFQTGVTHLMLLNENLQIVSERMVFNNLRDNISLEISSQKDIYKPRERVELGIRMTDIPSDTISASLAISITDDKDVKLDTTTHIIAEILLASELEGRINNPAFYFQDNKEALLYADLLMLTHGWRSYHVAEALAGELQSPQMKPEISYSFSGQVKNKRGRPYKNGKIKMTAVGEGFSEVVAADEKGIYWFDNFEFPDSTAYHFFSQGKDREDYIEMSVNALKYPEVSVPWKYGGTTMEKYNSTDFTDYVSKANRKYIQENGIRRVDLPEVTVSAGRRKKDKKRYDNHVTGGVYPDRWISPADIREFPPTTFEELFWRLPGVTEVSEDRGVVIRGGSAEFVLNGIPLNITYANLSATLSINDIAQVDLFTEPTKTLLFSRYGTPVIALTTWPPGVERPNDQGMNIRLILPLGYQKPVRFYSPKYDTSEAVNNNTADLRTTIYWNPAVVTGGNKETTEDFYTADAETTYSVVVEGISNNKKLIYYRKDAAVKVEK